MFYLIYPCQGPISSKFGWRTRPKPGWHSGLDIAVPIGTPIKACYKGVVEFVGPRGNYGNCVILYHPTLDKVWTLYAHLSEIEIKRLKWVEQGQMIALSGNTGYSSGPHTHIEVRVGFNGILAARNPLKYLKKKEQTIKETHKELIKEQRKNCSIANGGKACKKCKIKDCRAKEVKDVDIKKLFDEKKTYTSAIIIAVIAVLKYLGLVDEQTAKTLLELAAAFGLFALRSAVKKAEK